MAATTQGAFRTAVRSADNTSSVGPSIARRLVSTAFGWAIIVAVVTFVFLYFVNPPFVQCARTDKDVSRPPPNIMTISILSVLSGAAVLGCVYFNK